MINLADKIAAITGAGSGIGRALAIGLAEEGVNLALSDIDHQGLAETARMVEAYAVDCQHQVVNVAERSEIQSWRDAVLDHFKAVDIVINNAGVALGARPILEIPDEELEWIVNINLWGVIDGCRAFLPALMERPESALVNISSLFGLIGVQYQAPYCATKFAVRGFSESLVIELTGSTVTVTTVHPGGVKTNIVRRSRGDDLIGKQKMISRFDRVARVTPGEAATQIITAIRQKQLRVLIGKDANSAFRLARWMPIRSFRIFHKFQQKLLGRRPSQV